MSRYVYANNLTLTVFISIETPASYYNVSVTSSPSSYDIPIGTQVQLSCVSDPAPPSGVTFEWKTTITEDPLTQNSPSSPDATVTITHRHPKVSHYYCAMKWGNEVLGIGSTTLTIQSMYKIIIIMLY